MDLKNVGACNSGKNAKKMTQGFTCTCNNSV